MNPSECCDEWHHEEADCGLMMQEDFFKVAVDILYTDTVWTKKDRQDYDSIFEDIDG